MSKLKHKCKFNRYYDNNEPIEGVKRDFDECEECGKRVYLNDLSRHSWFKRMFHTCDFFYYKAPLPNSWDSKIYYSKCIICGRKQKKEHSTRISHCS